MANASNQDRVFSELDHARIMRLARQHITSDGTLPAIVDTLDDGELVEPRAIPPDVVTMYSRVLVCDDQGEQQELTLCYPQDTDVAKGMFSVLSPIGAQLLGLRIGHQAKWTTPGGESKSLRIEAISFQPEANEDYVL